MAGKYRAYPEYKNSGVDWLGEIPAGWQLVDLRRSIAFLTDFEANGSFADVKENVDLDSDEKYAWYLRATDLENNRIGIVEGNRTCDRRAYDYLSKTEIFGGEFLVAKRGEIGKVYVVPELACRATLAPNLYLIRLNGKLSPKYAHYWFSSLYGSPELVLANKSTTIGALYKDDVKACKVLLPRPKDQSQIASFLDHETAKIDTLIEKQQQLIKLLQEKRQAVISHAVTKGLNPSAPMRDSGVEWLGEVPEHWSVTRLKYHTMLFEQGWSPQCDSRPAESGEFGVLKVGCVNWGEFDSKENKALPKELEPLLQYLIKANDLLISRANSKELVGSAAVVDHEYDNLILCDKLYRLRFDEFVNPQWVSYFLALPIVRQQIELEASGASHSMQNIGQSTIRELSIIIPPIDEVMAIISAIKEKTAKFAVVLSKSEGQIELLRERRTALISAAVTGKIDVRDWQAPVDHRLRGNDEVAA